MGTSTRISPISPARSAISVFDSELGWLAIAWKTPATVARLWFGYPSRAGLWHQVELALGRCQDAAESWQSEWVQRFQDYAAGTRVRFDDLSIDTAGITRFQRKIVQATRKIGYGQTASYGELARRAGYPGAARAVGSVMANNRFPLIVPCHRVVAQGGRIGGFSSLDGVAMKRRLLALEGSINKEGALIS